MFTQDQIKSLNAKLKPEMVKTRKQAGRELSFMEGWQVIENANTIFGFGQWSLETVEVSLLEKSQYKKDNRTMFKVSYMAKVRVHVFDGQNSLFRDGVGFGIGSMSSIHDCCELAIKEAETDATKRALRTFGNQFGLALYDKEQKNVGDEEAELKQWVIDTIREARTMKTPEDINKLMSSKKFGENAAKLNDEQKDYMNGKLAEAIDKVSQAPIPEEEGEVVEHDPETGEIKEEAA